MIYYNRLKFKQMKKKYFITTMIILTSITMMDAQKPLPIKKLSIFKNGTALFVKEGTKNINNQELKLPIPEKALNGTYWLGANKDNTIKSILFKNDSIKVKKEAKDMYDLLLANKGKSITIHTSPSNGLDKTYMGNILDVNRESQVLKIQTDKKITAIDANDIYEIAYENDANKTYEDDSIARMMIVKFEKDAPSVGLQEYYMQSGISWMPSYFLKLKDEKNARLELKAIIENFSENIVETETELVVGAPQMRYSSQLDPMTYDYATADARFDNDAPKSYMYSNAMQTRAGYAVTEAMDGAFDANFNTEGEKNNDMYIYKLGKISLQKDTKGNFPIQASSLEYKDKYEVNIDDNINYFNTRYCDESDKMIDAFHSIEIKNTGITPFTTAPIFVVNDKDQFLAQDELKYTPTGSNASIQLSKAIDIIIKNNEEESSRAEAVIKIGKQVYSKVILKGTVTINNYQNKEVNLTVKKSVNGMVLVSSDGATNTKKTSYNYVNPNTEIKWDLKLGANEKKVITYEYEVFFTL
jgi:hypothetical protein